MLTQSTAMLSVYRAALRKVQCKYRTSAAGGRVGGGRRRHGNRAWFEGGWDEGGRWCGVGLNLVSLVFFTEGEDEVGVAPLAREVGWLLLARENTLYHRQCHVTPRSRSRNVT